MRIGMVTACYKPVINGVTRMVALYKEYLEAAGHEVYVFTIGDQIPDDEPCVIRSPGFEVRDFGYYLSPRYSKEAQKLVREMDIIHCHHLFMSVEMAHRYGRSPIIYTNHTRYDLYANWWMNLPQPTADAIMRQVWPSFCDYSDLVITPSESVRQVMLDFGVRRPIEVVENGLKLQPFYEPSHPLTKTDLGIPETAVLMMYVGRISPEKSLDTVIEQYVIARDIVPNLHLMIIGKGRNEEELKRQAEATEFADQIHFPGVIEFDEVPNYMAAADLFVTGSVSEVHPLTVIEAMASKLPIVAVSSPGIIDTVESGKTGILTTRPHGGLAAAMVGLALNDPQREQMSIAAWQASKRYTIEKTITRTIALYERLVEERPDLQRKKMHGRRLFDRERFQPFMDQIGKLLKPADMLTENFDWNGRQLPPSKNEEKQKQEDRWPQP